MNVLVGAEDVVTGRAIVDGLHRLGLADSPAVIVHTSLRSFGWVDGGAEAVCAAIVQALPTVLVPAFTWDLTAVPAPPGLARPYNSYYEAEDWADFDGALSRAVPFHPELPVDAELGLVPETMRRTQQHERSVHPLMSFLAVGSAAGRLIGAARLDWPLGPIEEAAQLGGDVLLLGVSHTSNTTVHLAEQLLGRARFYRYAKAASGVWMELPNIAGESHRFDEIVLELADVTREVRIGRCRARRIAVAEVLAATKRLVAADPGALLCADPGCRCAGARAQRVAHLAATADA